MWRARYQQELLEASRVVGALKLEEEAKRRGAWWKKPLVGQSESLPAAKKEDATPDGDEPQRTEDAPKKSYNKLYDELFRNRR
jgi:hypothetical protein